jgi:hypothetical protein
VIHLLLINQIYQVDNNKLLLNNHLQCQLWVSQALSRWEVCLIPKVNHRWWAKCQVVNLTACLLLKVTSECRVIPPWYQWWWVSSTLSRLHWLDPKRLSRPNVRLTRAKLRATRDYQLYLMMALTSGVNNVSLI